MNRKHTAFILLAILLLTAAAAQASALSFSDVPEDHPYYSAINYCRDKGFVYGVSSTSFMPNQEMTRAQFSAIWCRTLNASETNHRFGDVSPLKNSYDTAAIVLHSLGIINGTENNKFSPNGYITREQLAVIAKRTYKLSASNEEDYKAYGDSDDISVWARDGVSSCMNAELFKNLYDGENFMPSKPVTRAEICRFVYNIMKPSFKITIGELEGGSITASASLARPGTEITLTITPDEGKQLKSGTLKYNGVEISGTSFTMPERDVVVTAEFENIPSPLSAITITTQPDKTSYSAGETLDLTGLVVTAIYENETSAEVTGYTTSPAQGDVLSEEGQVTVTVSYTEDGATVTADFTVTVSAAQTTTEPEPTSEPETTTEPETTAEQTTEEQTTAES